MSGNYMHMMRLLCDRFFFLRWQIFTISKSIISSNTFMVFGHTADFYLTHDLASIIQIHNYTSAIYLSICKTANCPPFFLLNIVIRPSLWKWLSICVKEPRSCFHTSIRWCDNHFCGKSNILWNVLSFFQCGYLSWMLFSNLTCSLVLMAKVWLQKLLYFIAELGLQNSSLKLNSLNSLNSLSCYCNFSSWLIADLVKLNKVSVNLLEQSSLSMDFYPSQFRQFFNGIHQLERKLEVGELNNMVFHRNWVVIVRYFWNAHT